MPTCFAPGTCIIPYSLYCSGLFTAWSVRFWWRQYLHVQPISWTIPVLEFVLFGVCVGEVFRPTYKLPLYVKVDWLRSEMRLSLCTIDRCFSMGFCFFSYSKCNRDSICCHSVQGGFHKLSSLFWLKVKVDFIFYSRHPFVQLKFS